jgi:hypothetical protein
MTVDSTNLKSIGGATVGTEVKDGESASVTVSNLKLGPGDSIPNAVKFTFSGKPNVKMRVIIDFDISLGSYRSLLRANQIYLNLIVQYQGLKQALNVSIIVLRL